MRGRGSVNCLERVSCRAGGKESSEEESRWEVGSRGGEKSCSQDATSFRGSL